MVLASRRGRDRFTQGTAVPAAGAEGAAEPSTGPWGGSGTKLLDRNPTVSVFTLNVGRHLATGPLPQTTRGPPRVAEGKTGPIQKVVWVRREIAAIQANQRKTNDAGTRSRGRRCRRRRPRLAGRRAAGPATGSRPPSRRGRSRSASTLSPRSNTTKWPRGAISQTADRTPPPRIPVAPITGPINRVLILDPNYGYAWRSIPRRVLNPLQPHRNADWQGKSAGERERYSNE